MGNEVVKRTGLLTPDNTVSLHQDIRNALAEQANELSKINARLKTLEVFDARNNRELIYLQIIDVVRDSVIRRRILELTETLIERSALRAALEISTQHLSNEIKHFFQVPDLLIQNTTNSVITYEWAPILKYLRSKKLIMDVATYGKESMSYKTFAERTRR